MKPRFILPLLLATGLLTPLLRGQDLPAKIREIERKILLDKYQKAIQAVIGSAREIQSGAPGNAVDLLGKRLQWFTAVDGQLGGGSKIAAEQGQDMSESAGTLNELAWDMITSPDASARRPEVALKLADVALELGGEDWTLKSNALDTRARALFLLGKRDEAIATQAKAVAAVTNETEKAGFEATLASYRKGELPAIPEPADVPDTADPAAALAAKDLRTRTTEIIDLQRKIEHAEKENSGLAASELDRLKQELTKHKDQLEKLTQLADPMNQKGGSDGVTYLMAKLRTIVIPSVEFEDISLEEAVDFLRTKSVELDKLERDPARKGVNFVVRLPAKKPGGAPGKEAAVPEPIRIKELRLRNVPLAEALRYICQATRLRYKVDDFAVTLVSPDVEEDFFNRTFRVPQDFGSPLVPIQDLLKLCGVKFTQDASAVLIAPDTLVVRNTPTEIDKIEQLIQVVMSSRANREKSAQPAPRLATPVPVAPGGR